MCCFASMIVGTSCSKPAHAPDLESISAVDYDSKLPESAVTYFLPPGGALAAQVAPGLRKHFVELKVTNKSSSALDAAAVDAYFLGTQGAVLQIFCLNENSSIAPGASFTFHIDTDSYLEQMLLADQSRGRLRLLVSFSSPASFIADLPDFQDLRLKGQVPLGWAATTGTPAIPNTPANPNGRMDSGANWNPYHHKEARTRASNLLLLSVSCDEEYRTEPEPVRQSFQNDGRPDDGPRCVRHQLQYRIRTGNLHSETIAFRGNRGRLCGATWVNRFGRAGARGKWSTLPDHGPGWDLEFGTP